MTDTVKYAELSEVRAGTKLRADGGFTCIPEGQELVVQSDHDRSPLYVRCSEGRHFLDGQLNNDGEYVGLSLAQ